MATFTMDRNGHVLAASLIRRAEPLPPMPADISGPTATLTVSFALR